MAGAAVIVLLVVIALFAPWIAPRDPNRQDLLATLTGPSREHWLGTDPLGRDVLSRLIYGGRISLLAGAQATAVAFLLGVPAGLLAGYVGGWLDRVLVLVNDSLLSVPGLVLSFAMVGDGLRDALGIGRAGKR